MPTIEELTETVLNDMTEEDKEFIRSMRKRDLIMTHFDFGMDIRNRYNLWEIPVYDSEFPELRIHPDSVSDKIIEEIWKILQKEKKKKKI
jgi:hypothetical protein